MRKPVAAAIILCVFVIVVSLLVVGTLWHQKESYGNAYEKLTVGTPKSEVVKTFGTPTRTSKCDLVPSWDESVLSSGALALTQRAKPLQSTISCHREERSPSFERGNL
jgi:hypothetical protein